MSSDAWTFLSAFFSQPRQVGAILPSSRALARCMADGIDWAQANAVLEFGPGTGVFTREIIRRARPSAQVAAIEINPQLAARLQARFPRVRVHADSVAQAVALCRSDGIDQVDAILSGLPWAIFSPDDQAAFLRAATDVLKPGGEFVTFAYVQGLLLPAAKRFRRLLEQTFSQVTTSRVVWRNVPPALAYYCRV